MSRAYCTKHCVPLIYCECPEPQMAPNFGEAVWELREGVMVEDLEGQIEYFYHVSNDTGLCVKDLISLRNTINLSLIGRRWEWEECGACDGTGFRHALPCPICSTLKGGSKYTTYGLKPGQVRVKCGTCQPDQASPCWRGLGCLDGYRVEEVEG